ncbi:transposase [bacterium]|nr:MAG: transposase [bacterium]
MSRELTKIEKLLRAFDAHLYKHRNLIERFFCRIKHFRRIVTPIIISVKL